MNENYGFDLSFNNCYHMNEDTFNSYLSKEFPTSTASALSDILSNNTTATMTSSLSTTMQPIIHCNSQLNSALNALNSTNGNANLNNSMSSLSSSSSSISSCSSSPSPSHLSPAPVTSPLSSSSSSCISITSMIDFHKLKTEMTNNIVKPKSEIKSSSTSSAPLSSFSLCQSKHETTPLSSSQPINTTTNQNQTQNQTSSSSLSSSMSTNGSTNELSEEEKECLQISPFLSSVQENYCDITEYLTLPQNQAAKKLQMRPSTFSKRWKEASRNRKWPWRNVRKIDKEITCILHNMPKNGSISEEVESHLTYLLKQRQEELKPVVIRIS